MTAGSPPVIAVRDVAKSFGDRPVLIDIDLEVAAGETVVLLGASGSGKSTLLRCLVGLEAPDAGSIALFGTDIASAGEAELADLRQRLGMAFQGGALFGSMTIAENIDLPLAEHTGLPPSTRRLVVGIKLALVGLEAAADLYPEQLSGGMRKRAALARAMALDPDLLFFDEPSAGLDPVTAAGIDRLLIQLREVFGVTTVVVTHEMQSAFAIADRIALMHQGRFLMVGTPAEVEACRHPVVRQFLDRVPREEASPGSRYQQLVAEAAGG